MSARFEIWCQGSKANSSKGMAGDYVKLPVISKLYGAAPLMLSRPCASLSESATSTGLMMWKH